MMETLGSVRNRISIATAQLRQMTREIVPRIRFRGLDGCNIDRRHLIVGVAQGEALLSIKFRRKTIAQDCC
jgi:hypothetical protein